MKKIYALSFSSFYKASYANDMLVENGFRAVLKRLPVNITGSCGYGVYVLTDDLDYVKRLLKEKEINIKGIYETGGA